MNIKDIEFELLLKEKLLEIKMRDYDAWKLSTPDYEDQVITDKIDFTIEGDVTNLKQFENATIELAQKLDLDLYY